MTPAEKLALDFNRILRTAVNVQSPYAQEMLLALVSTAMDPAYPFHVSQPVRKIDGDYTWVGDVRCCYQKRNGLWRVVSENDQGLNHIFSPKQLEPI